MGDILSLVESAEQNIKVDDAERMTKRIMENKFDFNDFLTQSQMMGKMGSMGTVMKMLPGKPRLGVQHFITVREQMLHVMARLSVQRFETITELNVMSIG